MTGSAGVQPRILDADCHSGRDQGQKPLVLLSEVIRLRRLDVNYADYLVLDDEWNRKFGTHIRYARNISWVRRNIADQHRLTILRRQAGYSFSHLNANFFREFALVSHVKTNAQFLGLFIQQQDGKDLIIKYFAHQFSDAA